ncbi:hypothetical protein EC100869_1562, partial [Escherichia coli 10.0869]
MHVVT